MTISELLKRAATDLQPKKIVCDQDRDLGWFETEVLLAHVLKKDRTWLKTHVEKVLSTQCSVKFQTLVERRRRREPIAYILGEKEFYGLTFFTDKRALIPRPESEMLVDAAIISSEFRVPSAELVMRDSICVWDVGTGSGAIAIAIAKNLPQAHVLATDISAPALALARKNAKRLKTKNITFLKADLLSPTVIRTFVRMSPCRLIITANLPYLPTSDMNKLDEDVIKYEPSSALFAGKDGLKIIEKFLQQLAMSHLPFSHLFLEYDPPQTKKLHTLTKSLFPKAKIKIHKDLARRDRVMEISF
jgi:release factor glutamine methyltransferase